MSRTLNSDRWTQGRVHRLHQWTETLYSIQIEADIPSFTAGQFTKLALLIDDEYVERPYSFVNAPHESPLEFYFVTVPDGPLSNGMTRLNSGDPIWVMRRGSGFLTLNEVPDARHLWVLSTGTAIGPFLSILKTGEPWRRFERIVLVHAVRYASELSYQETIDLFQALHPDQFQFIPFVSREHTGAALGGRIPAAILEQRLEREAGLDISAEHSQFMICGNPGMVKDTTAALQERGLARNRRSAPGHITIENYW